MRRVHATGCAGAAQGYNLKSLTAFNRARSDAKRIHQPECEAASSM
jgi:hypothetical protein